MGDPFPMGNGQLWEENVAAHCKVMGHSTVSCAKSAETIDNRVDLRNHVLDGGADPPMGRGDFRALSVTLKNVSNMLLRSLQKASFNRQ